MTAVDMKRSITIKHYLLVYNIRVHLSTLILVNPMQNIHQILLFPRFSSLPLQLLYHICWLPYLSLHMWCTLPLLQLVDTVLLFQLALWNLLLVLWVKNHLALLQIKNLLFVHCSRFPRSESWHSKHWLFLSASSSNLCHSSQQHQQEWEQDTHISHTYKLVRLKNLKFLPVLFLMTEWYKTLYSELHWYIF